MKEVYIKEPMPNIHELKPKQQRYKAKQKPHVDSNIAIRRNRFIAFSLIFPCHIIPIIRPKIEITRDCAAIHSDGNSEYIVFIKTGWE